MYIKGDYQTIEKLNELAELLRNVENTLEVAVMEFSGVIQQNQEDLGNRWYGVFSNLESQVVRTVEDKKDGLYSAAEKLDEVAEKVDRFVNG